MDNAIHIDVISKKIEELAKQKEQVIAQLNAIAGAEQVLNDLLDCCKNEGAAE